MPLKLAVVVHGRFHAFDLTRELLRLGADVLLLTNYPKTIAEQFGVPRQHVRSCLRHGIASRLAQKVGGSGLTRRLEPLLHRAFGRWAASELVGRTLDAVHGFSGVCEGIFDKRVGPRTIKSVVRGSAHIRVQARLLAEEEHRCGCALRKPSPWMIAREMREYELADLVIVLSGFAAASFAGEGFPTSKLRVLPLGSELSRFQAGSEVIENRRRRILSGRPLKVLTVGSFSFPKGALDLAAIATALHGCCEFRFVGDCAPETRELRRSCRPNIEFVPRQRQFDLPNAYEPGDLFLFPTIQDGYAVVLAQAAAAGLPILATANCGGPELVREGTTGWILPVRDPGAFINRLRWCNEHRPELAEMVRAVSTQCEPRDWSAVAADLLDIYTQWERCQNTQIIH